MLQLRVQSRQGVDSALTQSDNISCLGSLLHHGIVHVRHGLEYMNHGLDLMQHTLEFLRFEMTIWVREGFKNKIKNGLINPSGLAGWGQPGSKIQPKKILF